MPNEESLPGVENGNIYGCDEVYLNHARLEKEVILLDDGGSCKGMGTAWFLAERGHQVTVVTADAVFGKELIRTMADHRIRAALAQHNTRFLVESVFTYWHGNGAEITSLLNGRVQSVPASAIVSTMTNIANDEMVESLRQKGVSIRAIGDCTAPRQAPYAIYEGRVAALDL